jgi:hypothetical protein
LGDQRSSAESLISIVHHAVRHYDVSTSKHKFYAALFSGSLVFFVPPQKAASAEVRFPSCSVADVATPQSDKIRATRHFKDLER